MRAFFLSAILTLASVPLHADIAWKTARMAPGSLMVMEDGHGAYQSHVARGQTNELFQFETYESKGNTPVFLGSYYTNDRGEVVRDVTADGRITRYEPHRCARTMGRCAYVIVHFNGFREARQRVTRETALGLAWKEWGLGGLVSTGALELDQLGAAMKGWARDHLSGEKTQSRRILMALN
ncbi:hypothetical protein [Salipiger aestuarii]|uniref:hypothetical protein n=1 Tax=Salipiger aestuarii TaxID=568098 RepID=UPI00123C7A01|nr:hypothetical protein [Salipiger aestuarii]KAA8614120.1 hypothetical protein AL037_03960 [Salipiger aestuarii]